MIRSLGVCILAVAGRGVQLGTAQRERAAGRRFRAAAPAAAPAASRPRIVVLGDSLTAGLGLSPTQAYPALCRSVSTPPG